MLRFSRFIAPFITGANAVSTTSNDGKVSPFSSGKVNPPNAPKFEKVQHVFVGSQADALTYVDSVFSNVSTTHVHDKFRLLTEYLDFIDSNDFHLRDPKWVQDQFQFDSINHVKKNATNGCCIAAALEMQTNLADYGALYAEKNVTKSNALGHEIYDHVGAFICYQNPFDPSDGGVILLDEYDHQPLPLAKRQCIKTVNKLTDTSLEISLDASGDTVTRSTFSADRKLLNQSLIPVRHITNPDASVGRHYFFGDPSRPSSHEFFMRRKQLAFAKLNFEKKILTLRLGTGGDAPQIKFSFDDIRSPDFSIDPTHYNSDIASFFNESFYQHLNVSKHEFWTNVKRFINKEALIKQFFCFPK